jgi:hypothetical protein
MLFFSQSSQNAKGIVASMSQALAAYGGIPSLDIRL